MLERGYGFDRRQIVEVLTSLVQSPDIVIEQPDVVRHALTHPRARPVKLGLLAAYAAYSLLQQAPKRVGFASGSQAFGHRELLGTLRSFGLVMEPVLTVGR